MSLDWIDAELDRLASADLLRNRVTRSGKLGPHIVIDGQRYISFASNDYLGIAADPAIPEVVARTVMQGGWGSGASPLIVGRSALHVELERRLAALVEKQSSLLFPTGFAANTGTIPALVGKSDVIFSDAKNHASIIDGCRLSGAKIVVYPHADVRALQTLIAEHTSSRRRLIVTDGLFSMDGDVAPIADLVQVARDHDAMLMVDEAHAIGVIGPGGSGICADAGVSDEVDVMVGTLSKSLGSHGGFAAGSEKLVQHLANRARSYVFSTAGPVAAAATALTALRIMRDEPARREHVLKLADQVREQLKQQGWMLGSGQHQIVQVIVGEAAQAIELSAKLRNRRFWIPCIRPPTVPAGEACLRLSLSSSHTPPMIENLVNAFGECR